MIYYKRCEHMPLYNFIKIIEEGNLKYVCRFGIGFKKGILKNWNNIFEQYNKLINSKSYSSALLNSKLIAYKKIKYNIVILCLNSLSLNWNEQLSNHLKDFGYVVREDNITKDIKVTRVKLKELLKEIKEIESNNNKKAKNDITSLLLELSKFQGYRIDPRKTNVKEFCIIFNNYKRYIKNENKNIKKHANRENR